MSPRWQARSHGLSNECRWAVKLRHYRIHQMVETTDRGVCGRTCETWIGKENLIGLGLQLPC